MKSFILGLFISVSFVSSAIADDVAHFAVQSYLKSSYADKEQVCGVEGRTPKATLIYGGGDTFPIQHAYLVSQEFDCDFFSTSLFVFVTIDENRSSKNPDGASVYSLKEIKSVTDQIHKLRSEK